MSTTWRARGCICWSTSTGPNHVNVGTGVDHTIREIAEMVAAAVGYTGETHWDPTKPDGTPRKLLDVSVLREAGWLPANRAAGRHRGNGGVVSRERRRGEEVNVRIAAAPFGDAVLVRQAG